MPENTPVKNDWFLGQTDGTISTDLAQVAQKFGDTDFTLSKKEDYWNSKSIQEKYRTDYGDEAKSRFDADYKKAAQSLQKYESTIDDFKRGLANKPTALEGTGYLFGNMEERTPQFTSTEQFMTASGAVIQNDEFTKQEFDPRQKDAEARKWMDDQGVLHDMPSWWDTKEDGWGWLSFGDDTGFSAMQYNYNYTSQDGREIVGWAYGNDGNPYSREQGYIRAVYEGDFAKEAARGTEYVSMFDYSSAFSDWSLEADWYDFIPRTIGNLYSGMEGLVGALGANTIGLVSDDARTYFEDRWLTASKSSAVTQSLESQQAGAFGNWDNIAGLVGDVVTQLMTGRAAGTLAMNLSARAGGRMAAIKAGTGSYSSLDFNMAKYASTAAMTLYGGKDMYENALANGFTRNEASALYMMNLGALFGVNRTFNWMDDTFTAAKVIKNNAKWMEENAAYNAFTKAGSKLEQDAAKAHFLRRAYDNTRNYLINNPMKAYPSAMATEAAEEMAEMLGEEVVKQAGNFYVWSGLAGREYSDEAGKGRFKDMWDEGYWAEFGEGLLSSAVGGAIGGAVGKKFFHSKQQDEETKTNLVDIVLGGEKTQKEFFKQMDNFRKEGKLGSTKYSITWDKDTESFKTMDALTEGEKSLSMNDANYQILQHEFNYVKQVVESLGSADAVKVMLDQNPKLKDMLNNMSLVNDVRKLTSDYLELGTKVDLETEQVQPEPEGKDGEPITEKERSEHIKKQAREHGIDDETSRELVRIKTELNDIQTGKAAEKYYLEAISRFTIFNTEKNPKLEEAYGKFGRFFLKNMMDASAKSAETYEEEANSIKEKIKDNDKLVNSLDKKSLEGLDAIEALLASGQNTYLSDKAREKLTDLADNFKISKEELTQLKAQIKEQVATDGKFDLSTVLSNDTYKALRKTNSELGNKIAQFMEAFYKAKLDTQVENVKTVTDLRNLQVDNVGDLIQILSDISLDHASDDVAAIGGDLMSFIESLTDEEITKQGELIGRAIGEDSEIFDIDAEEHLSNIQETELNDIVSVPVSKVNRLKKISEAIKGLPTEEEHEYDPTNVNFFLNGYRGDENGIEDTGNLMQQTNNLIQQYVEQMLEDGTPGFNNLEEATEVLNQVRARLGQIQMLRTTIDDFAEMKVRHHNIANNDGSKSTFDLLNGAISDAEKSGFTKLFNKTLINPVAYKKYKEIGKDKLSGKELEEFEQQEQTLTNLRHNEYILKKLAKRLRDLQRVAESNQDAGKIEDDQKSVMSVQLGVEARILDNLMDLGQLYAVNNPEAKAFEAWYASKGQMTDKTEQGLIEAFQTIQDGKALLFSLNNSQKTELLDKYYRSITAEFGEGILNAENRAKMITAATSLFFNEQDFYVAYKAIVQDTTLKGLPSMQQEKVALTVAAHMNTDLGKILKPYLDPNDMFFNSNDVITVLGLQGTGKSSFVLGVGAKIGQYLQAQKYGPENSKVLLASNTPQQVAILSETARKFGVQEKGVGAQPGVYGVEELIELLEKPEELEGVSTIMYDEATFIQYINTGKNSPYNKKTDLEKVVHLINSINAKRDGIKEPKLKLVLLGDPNQNGYVGEDGNPQNLSTVEDVVFSTLPLTRSFRSNITALVGVTEDLLSRTKHSGVSLDRVSSTYGIISGAGVNLYGGVKFVKPQNAFDDDILVENIREQIERYNQARDEGGEEFTVGIILPEGYALPDSKLKDLYQAYPNNIFVTTHNEVQGSEFSYVVAIVNAKEIGNAKNEEGNNIQKEKNNVKKLSTTIGRAKYYTHVINETERQFTSEETDSIVVTAPAVTYEITEKLRDLKSRMIRGEAVEANIESLEKSQEEIDALNKQKAETSQQIEEEVKAEQDKSIKFDPNSITSDEIEEDRINDLYNLLNEGNQAYAREIEEDEERARFIRQRVDVDNRLEATQINEIADAKIALMSSNDPVTRVAAQQKLNDPTNPEFAFTVDNIALVQKMIDELFKDQKVGFMDPSWSPVAITTKKLYDAEVVKLRNEALSDTQIDSLDAKEVIELEEGKRIIINETAENLKEKIEEAEDTDNPIIENDKKILNDIDVEDEVDYDDDSEDVLGLLFNEQNLVPEGETKEARKARLEAEAEVEMSKMEEAGIIAAYSHNTGEYNGMKGAELDMFSLEFLNDKIWNSKASFPKEIADYKDLQLKALGLKSGYSIGDFDYSFVGFKRGGYSSGVFIATEKKTGNKVIVGGLYQIQKLRNNGKIGGKLVAKLDESIEKNNGYVEWTIHNPKHVLNLEALSPGEITRSDKKTTLTEFHKLDIPGVNISKDIFVSTKAIINGEPNPHRGEAFLLYTFNDKHNFSATDVDNIIKAGLTRHKNGVLKGFKDGIGVIHLDNRPTSLKHLNSVMRETFSTEAIELSKTVNSNAGSERMAVAMSQIRVALNNILDIKIGIPQRITDFLKNKEDKELQFNKENDGLAKIMAELKEWKNSTSEGSQRAFNAFVETVKSITDQDVLGKFQQDEENGGYLVKTAKKSGKRYPAVAPDMDNIMTILNGVDAGEDVANEVRFELNKFISRLQEKALMNKVDDDILATLFDNIFAHSHSFKNGLYMRPTADKKGKDKTRNIDFARVYPIPNITDMYNIRVANVSTPMIRFQADQIIDLMDGNVVAEEEIIEIPQEVPTNDGKELFAKINAKQEISLKAIEFATDEIDLEEQKIELEDQIKAWEEEVKDLSKDAKAVSQLNALKEEFNKKYEEALDKILNGDEEQTQEEVGKTHLFNATNKLVNNADLVNAEKEAVKSAAIKSGTFMKNKFGGDTKLNEEQWLLVRTPSFKAWAGDWESADARAVSVVIDDETGEPKKFYHGSPAQDISEFETETSRFGHERDALGAWFTDEKLEAFGFQVLSFTDPIEFSEKFGQGLTEVEIEKLYNNVTEYIGIIAAGLDQTVFDGTDTEWKQAKELIEGNSRMYEVFVRGTVQMLGDPNTKQDLQGLITQINPEADSDIVMFRNIHDGLVSEAEDLNVTTLVVKDKANIYISGGVKAGEVMANTVNEDVSPQMEEFKASMAEISNRFIQMSEFIFSTTELDTFLDDMQGLLNSAEAKVSKVLDEGTEAMANVENVLGLMDKNIKNLSNKVRTTPENLRTMIRKNMEKSFSDDQLPVITPGQIPTLSELLITFHKLKNKGADITAIQREIGKRYLDETTESAIEIRLRELLDTPESSMVEFEAKAKELKAMNLPKETLKSALQIIADRVGDTMEFEKIASLAAAGKLTVEEINKLKESDFKTLLEDSFSETLTPEAEKIINSTWSGLEKFLSLPIENSAAAEIAVKELKAEIAKAEAKFNSLLQFIGNTDKKNYLMEQFESLKNAAQSRVESAIETLPSEVDMTVASDENLFPTFTDKALTTTLTAEVQEMVSKLDDANKKTWIAAINGELIHDVTGMAEAKLYSALRKVTTPVAYDAIQDYVTKKTRDSICK